MPGETPTPETAVRFGDAGWDPNRRTLVVRGAGVRLPWRAAECLNLLVERRGELVSRDEFHERVWAGAVMEDSNLAHAIAAIRKALDPAPDGGSYIETVAKMGYRLAVPVESGPAEREEAAPSEPAAPVAARRTTWVRWVAGLGLLIALGAGGFYWAMREQRLREAEQKVAEAFPILRRGSTADGVAARSLLEVALRLVPDYPPARAGLAEVAARYGKSPFTPAAELARSAVQDDPSCVECRAVLGYILMSREWRWEEAGIHLKAAVELQPQETQWRLWYGQWLALMGRFDEAAVHANKAMALDPSRPHPHSLLASIYYLQQRYADAEREAMASNLLDARHAPGYQWLARIYMMLPNEESFVRARCDGVAAWDGHFADYFNQYGQRQIDVLKAGGRKALVRLLLAEVREGPTLDANRYDRALWQMWIGEREAALGELEAAVQARPFNVIYTPTDPMFAPLREEPRFREVVRQLGLEGVLSRQSGATVSSSR
jgi:DNA-binding winged helix-turn-helix (wHTH) protein/Flp pilus assembly protein TadD